MNTFSEIDLDLLRLKPSRVVGKMGMRVMDISYEDKPLVITLRNVIVPFEPSVYNGTGTEKRKGIVFSIDSAELAGFQHIEQVCQERMDKPERSYGLPAPSQRAHIRPVSKRRCCSPARISSMSRAGKQTHLSPGEGSK